MQRKSTVFSGAVEYAAQHEDLLPYLEERDEDESYWCNRSLAKFVGEDDGKILMEVIFNFTHIVDGVQKEENVIAKIYYNRSNGSYRLLEIEVN